MKSFTVFALVGFVGLIGLTQAVDYCSLCSNHIACKNSGDFGPKCPKERESVKMTPDMKDFILKTHNSFRNDLAGGKIKGYKPASRMGRMVWDDELAKLAQLNTITCVFKHDSCHDTAKYSSSGQNLAYRTYSGYARDDKKNFEGFMRDWWAEKKDCNMNVIKKYPSNWRGKAIGHFTIMAKEDNVAVGCAASWYKKGSDETLLGACNYATTNWQEEPTYTEGSPQSKCDDKDRDYKNLCGVGEKYN